MSKYYLVSLMFFLLLTGSGWAYYEDFEDPDNVQATLSTNQTVEDGYLKGYHNYPISTAQLDGTYPASAEVPNVIAVTYNMLGSGYGWASVAIVIGKDGDDVDIINGLCITWHHQTATFAGGVLQVQALINDSWGGNWLLEPIEPPDYDPALDYLMTVVDYGTSLDIELAEVANPANNFVWTDIDISSYIRQGDYIGVGQMYNGTVGVDDVRAGIDLPSVGTIDPCSISVTEAAGAGHSDTYTITLTEQPPVGAIFAVYLDPCDLWADGLEQVTVLPAKSGDPNTALDIVFDSTNWDTPVTVTVTAYDDSEGEDPADLALNHSLVLVSGSVNSETDPNWTSPSFINSSVAVAVADDDQRYAVTVDELGGLAVSETGTTSDDFTVVIEKQPTITLTIDLATDGETQLSSNSLVFNNVNWNVAQTVSITAVDDSVGEADPHTGDIMYSVDSGITWNALASDNFNDTTAGGWTTYINEPGADVNAVHDGAELLTYGSTMAISPGDFTAPYRLTVECDLGSNTYNVIYLRNDGISHNYENGDVIRCGWWDDGGGSLVFNIAGNDHSQYNVPMPGRGEDPDVYRFIIEDNGDSLSIRMENVANPSNFLETSASGSYAALGAGTKIALGLIEDDGTDQGVYCAYDNFMVEAPTGSQEQLDWAGAPIEVVGGLDGDADVTDNDCLPERATQKMDFDDDCDVDLADFAVLAEEYQKCVKPHDGVCF